MLGNIGKRNILVRLICMMMFVLMQFDIYGYDLLNTYRQSDVETSVLTLEDETTISESYGMFSEWSDPIYKRTSRKFFSDFICISLVVSLLLPFIISIDNERQYIIAGVRYFCEQESYLRFRSLLI